MASLYYKNGVCLRSGKNISCYSKAINVKRAYRAVLSMLILNLGPGDTRGLPNVEAV